MHVALCCLCCRCWQRRRPSRWLYEGQPSCPARRCRACRLGSIPASLFGRAGCPVLDQKYERAPGCDRCTRLFYCRCRGRIEARIGRQVNNARWDRGQLDFPRLHPQLIAQQRFVVEEGRGDAQNRLSNQVDRVLHIGVHRLREKRRTQAVGRGRPQTALGVRAAAPATAQADYQPPSDCPQ